MARAAAHRETLREARLAQREMLLWARGRRDAMILNGARRQSSRQRKELTMKFVLTGGGTAGHINPLLLAEILQECDHEVFFAGTPQGVEARLVGQTDIPFVAFEASGFDRERPPYARHLFAKNFALGPQGEGVDVRSSTRCRCRLWDYVSIPVGMAAEQLNVPVVVHEQNSVMGMANKFLGKKAAAVALTYEVAGKDIADASKLIVTGNPVRSSVLATREQGQGNAGHSARCYDAARFRRKPGCASHQRRYLVARQKAAAAIDGLYVVHITGPKEYEVTCEELRFDR